jgi:hypothetical protein
VQVFDNAMVAAGLLDDSRSMLPRLNMLLERLVATHEVEEEGGEGQAEDEEVKEEVEDKVEGEGAKKRKDE